jgi:hypothetical protein
MVKADRHQQMLQALLQRRSSAQSSIGEGPAKSPSHTSGTHSIGYDQSRAGEESSISYGQSRAGGAQSTMASRERAKKAATFAGALAGASPLDENAVVRGINMVQ